MSSRKQQGWTWVIPAALVVAGAAILLLAPEEATIGRGIKVVYLHVALIWTGLLGLLITGLLGSAVLIGGRRQVHRLMTTVGWVSLVMFAAGVGTSLVAEIVNWGGIAWREPRTAANLNLLAFAAIVQIANSWLSRPRIEGLLNLIVAAAAVWATLATEVQLHPDDAIGASGSGAIQFAFYGLFVLCSLIGAWLVWYLTHPAAVREGQALNN